MTDLSRFAEQCLQTWVEPDPDIRSRLIHDLWAPEGQLAVSSVGTVFSGPVAIAEHIGRVHDELITSKGLRLSYDQHVQSGDAVLLRWSISAPGGSTVGRGIDTVFRTADGRVRATYMFMGVD